eukprot:gene21486-28462_t
MPPSKAREAYANASQHFPLLMNAQDSRGWTLLMHAVANRNPEITKIIVSNIKPKSGILGLVSSGISTDESHYALTPFEAGVVRKSKYNREIEPSAAALVTPLPSRPSPSTHPAPSARPSARPSASNRPVPSARGSARLSASNRPVPPARASGRLSSSNRLAPSSRPSARLSPSTTPSPATRPSLLQPAALLSSPTAETEDGAVMNRASSTSQHRYQSMFGSATQSFTSSNGDVLAPSSQSFSKNNIRKVSFFQWAVNLRTFGGDKQRSNSGMDQSVDPDEEWDRVGAHQSPNALTIAIAASSADCVSLLLDAVLAEKEWDRVGAHQSLNALTIAIGASSTDCVSLLLDAVLAEKVTVTNAISDVAEHYPEMCYQFFRGLPLVVLGDMEIPSTIAAQGTIVCAANSYTSYKEMWQKSLKLDSAEAGPMVMMEASMVRLPYAASLGKGSILHTLMESDVPVQTFGSDTVKAVINYKWKNFAMWKIFTKAIIYIFFIAVFTVYAIIRIYMFFIAVFTVYAIVRVDDNPYHSLEEAMQTTRGRTTTVLSVIIFCFGLYYLVLEAYQLRKLGIVPYFSSLWNLIDVASYSVIIFSFGLYYLVLEEYHLRMLGIVPYLSSLWDLIDVASYRRGWELLSGMLKAKAVQGGKPKQYKGDS